MLDWEKETYEKICRYIYPCQFTNGFCGYKEAPDDCPHAKDTLDLIKHELRQFADKVKVLPFVDNGEYVCDKVLERDYGIKVEHADNVEN